MVPIPLQNVSPNADESPHPKSPTDLPARFVAASFGRKSNQSSCRSPAPHVDVPSRRISYSPVFSSGVDAMLCTSSREIPSLAAI